MAKITVIDEKIPNLDQPWAGVDSDGKEWGYDKARVEELIKEQFGLKVGVIRMSSEINEQNFYSLEVFASKEDESLYDSDPEKYFDKIKTITIPISTVQGDAYAALLSTNISNSATIVSTKDSLMIPLNFRAVKISQVGNENAGVTGTLTIQRRIANGEWANAYEISSILISNNYGDTDIYQEVDILPALINAKQEIRVRASFQYEDVDGSTKTAYSSWVMIGKTVTKTTLRLDLSTDYSQPLAMYDANGNLNNFAINYIPFGDVEKKLHISVRGSLGTYTTERDTNENGAVVAGCNINVSQNDQYGLLTHGIKYVEAYLETEDGMGNTIQSNVLTNQFMVASDDSITTPYLLLQNVLEDTVNFMQSDICEYAVYSPYDDKVKIAILMTSYSNDYETDRPEEYFRLEQEVEPRKQNKLVATVEIETESTEDSYAYLRVRRISDDVETDFIKESTDGDVSSYTITVDNRNAFTPIAGSTFLVNPKVRSNNEENPARILNSRNNNEEVEATFEGFGFLSDGWIDAGGQRVLRVPAGGKLTIKRNIWRSFLNNPDSQLNFEFDFAVHNITNTTDPIIDIAEDTESGFKGLRLNAMDGWIKSKSYNVSDDCLFSWEEDSRNHVFVNIENMVQPQGPDVTYNGDYTAIPDPSDPSKLIVRKPIARIFLNGCLQREVPFNVSDVNEWTEKGCDIVIGNVGCDIDIYSFRAYENENRNITPRSILMRNYLATLTSSDEKRKLFERNNITDGSGRISLDAAKALGLNCMVWHGTLPSKINEGEYKGWYEYFRYDENRQLMKEYSGTNCKASGTDPAITSEDKPLIGKAQGTTAKTYYDHNVQDDNSKVKTTIKVAIEDFHDSITLSEPYSKDGAMYVDIYGGNLGKNFPVENKPKAYPFLDGYVTVPDGWIDANGKYRGMGYMVSPDTALAQKKVIKINYASSMQSHLLGACKTYDLLHRKVVGNTPLQDRVPTAVSAKHTEPFLFFHEINGNIYYKGLGNYGAAKMDKVAWGYAKDLHPNFALIEGSDNNMTLTDFRVPFDKKTAIYNCKEEYWEYNGNGSWDFDGGATVEYAGEEDSIMKQLSEGWQFKNYDADSEAPSANIRDRWAFVCNYIYLHGANIRYFNGTYSQFISAFNSASDADKADYLASKMWFASDDGDYKAYHLYRWDALTMSWINAGLLGGDDMYRAIDLRTDYMTKFAYEANKGNFDKMNTAFKAAVTEHMHKTIKYVVNEDSLIFNYCFVLMFLAGTDNSSKNTYFKIMPIEKAFVVDKEFNEWYKTMFGVETDFNFSFVYQVYLDGDDMDSILRTNNNSHQTKPYYIERRYPYADDKPNECLYEGMRNQIFNYVEEYAKLYPNTLPLMMNKILTAATDLVDDNDNLLGLTKNKKSAWGFLHKFFFNTQCYFPQICYNEQARIRYEFPHMIGYVSSGSGARSIQPISQSLGSQLENELMYMRQRLVYMASYARYSALAGAAGTLGLSDNTPSLSFTGAGMQYKFKLKSYQYIYPTFNSGSSKIEVDKRLKPDEEFEYILNTGGETGDAGIGLYAIDYYTSIGNVGDFAATNATFIVQGKRLREFIAEPTSGAPFAPQKINVLANQLDVFSLKGCVAISGNIDLSTLTRCREIDLTGTKLYEVGIPYSANLTSIKLGDSIQRLVLDNTPNLETMRLESFDKLQSLSIGDNVGTSIDTKGLVVNLYSAKNDNATTNTLPLTYLSLKKVDWNDFDISVLTWLTDDVANLNLTGRISMKEPSQTTSNINFDIKNRINAKFGNVDSEDSSLRIIYNVIPLTGITLQGSFDFGPEYPKTEGKAQFSVLPSSSNANNHTSIVYEVVEHPSFSAVSIDSKTGLLTATSLSASEDFATIKATAYTNGNDYYNLKVVSVWSREALVGDLVYHDGTYSSADSINQLKSPIGVCCYIAPRYTSDTEIDGVLHKQGEFVQEYHDPNDIHTRIMVALVPSGQLIGTDMYSHYVWGMSGMQPLQYPVNSSKCNVYANGLTFATTTNLPSLPDIYNWVVSSRITKDNFRSTDYPLNNGFIPFEANKVFGDGFAFKEEEQAGYKEARTLTKELAILAGDETLEGKMVNSSMSKTLNIIKHRNNVLNSGLVASDGIDTIEIFPSLPIPTGEGKNEMKHLRDLLIDLATYTSKEFYGSSTINNSGKAWWRVYWPAASYAYAYEPTIQPKHMLDKKFIKHKWFLPSGGIMGRIAWHYINGDFSKALASGTLDMTGNLHLWSCTEHGGNYANEMLLDGSLGDRYKTNTYVRVYPICAF